MLSEKQKRVLTWWHHSSYDGIICDGAVRSGKSYSMLLSFLLWAFCRFEGKNFALCGKTVTSLERNLLGTFRELADGLGFSWKEKGTKHLLEISYQGRKNFFYLFGGQNRTSAALIQGITLAGVLLDEVALMPRSFVEQALARCSAADSKLWFNCNPEGPYHWFYQEWIQKAAAKKMLYLHFTMEDNPGLSTAVKERYGRLYSGNFYRRYVLGEWVSAQGLVYPEFSEEKYLFADCAGKHFTRFFVSCDYGTVNPTSMGLWGEWAGCWYRIREWYYDSKKEGRLKTDEEYYRDLKRLLGEINPEAVILDPSAASFMEVIRRHGEYRVIPANNNVTEGISRVRSLLTAGKLFFHESCKDSIREFYQYRWKEQTEKDIPRKEYDHAMDDIRYFVNTALQERDDFFVLSVERGAKERERREIVGLEKKKENRRKQ